MAFVYHTPDTLIAQWGQHDIRYVSRNGASGPMPRKRGPPAPFFFVTVTLVVRGEDGLSGEGYSEAP
jgi:hypothetical protein